MSVKQALKRLERRKKVRGPCSLCQGRGALMYVLDGETPREGCPRCGRRMVIAFVVCER